MVSTWTVTFALFLLCLATLPVSSSSLPASRSASFTHSLLFTRRIRTRVQSLLLQYKAQLLGDEQFEDRSQVLHSLPSITSGYTQWLRLADAERLHRAEQDLRTFCSHLDSVQRQLAEERALRAASLTLAMRALQTDLRDLLRQVSTQLHWIKGTSSSSPAPRPSPSPHPSQLWSRRLRGYVVLRDLGRYLGKLARDFTLLRAKHQG